MSLPKPYYSEAGVTLYCADCRDLLPELEAELERLDRDEEEEGEEE